MDTIEELYYGNIQPNLKKEIKTKGFIDAMEFVSVNEDTLLNLLDGKEKDMFNKILTAQATILGESEVAHFKLGFRLGAKMALDTFASDEPLPITE
ncbi:MAG: hypothetical protein R3Y09_12050 [Clostridia bacterium]